MRNTLTIISFLFLTNFLMAQSGEWRVLSGVKISSKWGQKPPYSRFGEDVFIDVEEVKPIVLSTFSAIYSNKLTSTFQWSLGFNYNNKGFREIGVGNLIGGGGSQYYNRKNTMHYLGILGGVRCNFIQKDRWHIGFETLLNPEIQVQNYLDFTKLNLSTINMFYIEKKVNDHFSIVLNVLSLRSRGAGMNPWFSQYALCTALKVSQILHYPSIFKIT